MKIDRPKKAKLDRPKAVKMAENAAFDTPDLPNYIDHPLPVLPSETSDKMFDEMMASLAQSPTIEEAEEEDGNGKGKASALDTFFRQDMARAMRVRREADVVPLARDVRNELIEQYGGEESLTATQKLLIDSVAFLTGYEYRLAFQASKIGWFKINRRTKTFSVQSGIEKNFLGIIDRKRMCLSTLRDISSQSRKDRMVLNFDERRRNLDAEKTIDEQIQEYERLLTGRTVHIIRSAADERRLRSISIERETEIPHG